MTTFAKKIVCLSLAAASVLALASRRVDAACPVQAPADLLEAMTLTYGTHLGAPPQGYFENNIPKGLDVEITTALAEAMCLKPRYANLAFAGLFPALDAKKFDAAVSQIGITEQRQQSFDFVPYFTGGMRIVVRKSSNLHFATETDVCGHSIGLLAGSTEAKDIDATKKSCPPGKDIDVKIYPDNNEVVEQIRKGNVEAVFLDWPFTAYLVQQNADDFGLASPVLSGDGPGTPRHLQGIMIRKGDAAMKNALEAAMKAIESDGTYKKLLAKWHLEEGSIVK